MSRHIVTMGAGLLGIALSLALMFHAQSLCQIGLSVGAFLVAYIVFMWEAVFPAPYSNG